MEYKDLNDGSKMPNFGLGFWNMKPEEVVQSCLHAIKVGYRLFDIAFVYGNEKELGEALKKSGLKRNDYFVVTKLSPNLQGYEGAKQSMKTSLEKLGLDYVDLFLIHTPNPGKNIESWKACCEMKKEGLTKSIGVSNYNVSHLKGLMEAGLEIPAVNQIEFHPWYQEENGTSQDVDVENQVKGTSQDVDVKNQNECLEFCAEKNIAVMAYCPLARGTMFQDGACQLVDELSKKYQKSKAQIMLRWSLQRNVIPVAKSSNCNRIRENFEIFDFEISDEDMTSLNGLHENKHCSKASSVMQKTWEEVEKCKSINMWE